jgi:ABC-2 type transport system permease protein
MQRLRFLVRKEFQELRRNPRLFGLVVVAPILQLTLLGYAATTDVRDVPMAVADGDRSAASRELIARFEASPYFSVVRTVSTTREIEPFLESGRAWLALSIPAGYGDEVGSGRPAVVQVIADGTDANATTVALGYASSLVAGYAQELASSAAKIPGAGIDARIRIWFNPQLESRHFMIPGVLALVLLVVTANLAAMAIVREKELGTLE